MTQVVVDNDWTGVEIVNNFLACELSDYAENMAKKHNVHVPHTVHLGTQGNFVVCYLLPSRGKVPVAFGVAKRKPGDRPDLVLGAKVALGRAIKMLSEKSHTMKLAS